MALLRRSPRTESAAAATTVPEAAREEEIRAAQDRFIGFWGEMGTRWGVQRSMAEVHALLFIAAEPLSAEDIMERLSISRGSVSTTLKQLVEWGLVQRVNPKLSPASRGAARTDRREFHQAEQDVWKLFYTILRARKRREFDPLIEQLGGCKVSQRAGRKSDRERSHVEAFVRQHRDDRTFVVLDRERHEATGMTRRDPGVCPC
jgi:DNA-binding transcriptional regulator GbsR (MarR family)